MPDFFISYTSVDRTWAEWIAFVLEEVGFTTAIQAWDFRPGSNFVLEMQKAASGADRTIMVLSPDYLKSQFTAPEWASAFVEDPKGIERKLLPIVVRKCAATGLLASIVHINLAGVDESAALQCLLDGVSAKRAKPSQRPPFPGSSMSPASKPFPGSTPVSAAKPIPYIPEPKEAVTEADRRRFIRQAFEVIRAHFEMGMNELSQRNGAIECDFQPNTATDFEAEIFLGGKSTCRCRVWMGGMIARDGIAYAEGSTRFSGDACNETLSVEVAQSELYLRALMGGFSQLERLFDLKRLTPQQAAEYLWRRFVTPLDR
jgi:TIR domain-containing protein